MPCHPAFGFRTKFAEDNMHLTSRRQFIKSAAALAGTALAPNLLLGQNKGANPLNVAAIGCGGRGLTDVSEIARGNRVAFLCDVDLNMAKGAI